MAAASSGTPSGAGLSFFRLPCARSTMPFFGPSFAARSNSSTGTRRLTSCAAICAPITPAPSTATLRTWNRFMAMSWVCLSGMNRGGPASFDALPDLGAEERAEVAAHFEPRTAVDRLESGAVHLAVVRVEDVAAVPDRFVIGVLLHAAQDHQADQRLVLAIVGALVAHRVGLGLGVEQLLDGAAVDAVLIGDAHQRLLRLGVVVDRFPQSGGGRLRQREVREYY